MERNTFKIVFFCKKTKINKKGKAPIYVRITTDGVSTEIFTKCQIAPEHWNQRAERSMRRDKVDEKINNIISTFRCNILAVYDQLIKEGKNPTCQAIKLRLANPDDEWTNPQTREKVLAFVLITTVANDMMRKYSTAEATPFGYRRYPLLSRSVYGSIRRLFLRKPHRSTHGISRRRNDGMGGSAKVQLWVPF